MQTISNTIDVFIYLIFKIYEGNYEAGVWRTPVTVEFIYPIHATVLRVHVEEYKTYGILQMELLGYPVGMFKIRG